MKKEPKSNPGSGTPEARSPQSTPGNPEAHGHDGERNRETFGEPDGRQAATNDHARSQVTNADDSSQDWEKRNL
jgi:hypothetical protein